MVNRHQMHFRKAETGDIEELLAVCHKAYNDCTIRDLVNAYDLYQSVVYNYGLVLSTNKAPQQVVGCFFNYIFHSNGDQICNLKRWAVDPDFQGIGLGKCIFEYNQLLMKETYGSRIQTGLIEYTNFLSLYLTINRLGGVIDFITEDLKQYFLAYSFVINLNTGNWEKMEVSQEKLIRFIKGLKEGEDYIMFSCDDEEMAKEVCRNSNFKIAAVLLEGEHVEKNSMVALSNELLKVKLI